MEVGGDETRRRARLLDLGNQRIFAGSHAPLERFEETAWGRGRLRSSLDRGVRPRLLGCGDLLALVGFDLFQDVAHCAFDTLISRSSRPSASPLSIDLAAIAAPSL